MAMVWEGSTGVSVESQIARTDIHWVCAQPTEMVQCCCWRWWPSWQEGALRQHYLEAPHCSWHVYFTGGGVRLSSCRSAPHLQSWCSHSSEARVPVCWRDSLPMSSEGLAPFSALLLPESLWQAETWSGIKWWQLACTLEMEGKSWIHLQLGVMELEVQPVAVILSVLELSQKGWFGLYSSADCWIF